MTSAGQYYCGDFDKERFVPPFMAGRVVELDRVALSTDQGSGNRRTARVLMELRTHEHIGEVGGP